MSKRSSPFSTASRNAFVDSGRARTTRKRGRPDVGGQVLELGDDCGPTFFALLCARASKMPAASVGDAVAATVATSLLGRVVVWRAGTR